MSNCVRQGSQLRRGTRSTGQSGHQLSLSIVSWVTPSDKHNSYNGQLLDSDWLEAGCKTLTCVGECFTTYL